MTIKEFEQGWRHFCNCIDFAHSNLDAEAIKFMMEMPASVNAGLTNTFTNDKCSKRRKPEGVSHEL